jgi:hypothetical protein
MARKTIPANPTRDRTRDDESLLFRSAESLGRMIGSLQRQLDIATGRITTARPNGNGRKSAAAKRSSVNATASRGTRSTRGGTRKKSLVRKSAKKR